MTGLNMARLNSATSGLHATSCVKRNVFLVSRSSKRTSVQSLYSSSQFIETMKYGKYDLHKSSTNASVGTSYSWYYRKNEYAATDKKKHLERSLSDSTLFSDYINQIDLFEKERCHKKMCKKSISDVSKNNRVKYNPHNIKPVRMEPFIGNFYYGKPLPGFEKLRKTDENIYYLPDSEIVTASEDNTAESLTAPTVVDIPEFIKNPIYGCDDTDIAIPTSEYSNISTISKDSQLKSSSCTELRNAMCHSKVSEDILIKILKDFKKIMKEWNHTIKDHCTSVSHCNKKDSFLCQRRNSKNYSHNLHSTLSFWNSKKYVNSLNRNHCDQSFFSNDYETYRRTYQSLNRNQIFNNYALTSTYQNIKNKYWFRSYKKSLNQSEYKCLQAINEDYDKRLQDWCDTVSHCSSLLTSVITLYFK